MEMKECKDKHCAAHKSISTRGRTFRGLVIKTNAHATAVIEWSRPYYLPKFERYEKRRTKIKVHNPECMDAREGDWVTIKETRPISKTKHFVIINVEKKE
jgi:small subunit ribosomal protein S17